MNEQLIVWARGARLADISDIQQAVECGLRSRGIELASSLRVVADKQPDTTLVVDTVGDSTGQAAAKIVQAYERDARGRGTEVYSEEEEELVTQRLKDLGYL